MTMFEIKMPFENRRPIQFALGSGLSKALQLLLWILAVCSSHACAQNARVDEYGVHLVTDSSEIARIRLLPSIPMPLAQRLLRNEAEAHRQFQVDLLSSDSAIHFEALSLFSNYQLTEAFSAQEIDILYEFARQPRWPMDRACAIMAIPLIDRAHAFTFLQAMLTKAHLTPDERLWAFDGFCYDSWVEPSVDFLIDKFDHLRHGKATQSRTDLCGEILEELICLHNRATPATRMRIEHVLLAEYSRHRYLENSIYELEEAFLTHPSAVTLPYFQDRLRDSSSSTSSFLMAIARLQGEAARPLLLSYLRKPQLSYMAISAVNFAWADDAAGVRQVLRDVRLADSMGYLDAWILEEAWQIGGPKFAQEVLSGMPQRTRPKWAVYDYAEVFGPMTSAHPWVLQAQKLYDLGLLPRPLALAEIDSIRQTMIADQKFDFGKQLLKSVPQHFAFSLEEYPSRSLFPDEIIPTFLSHAAGKLDGLEFFTEYDPSHFPTTSDQSWMIFHGKCYRMKRWPSLEIHTQIEIMLNRILQDCGHPAQFVSINMSAQEANYLFCQKEIAWQAIELLGLEKRWGEN